MKKAMYPKTYLKNVIRAIIIFLLIFSAPSCSNKEAKKNRYLAKGKEYLEKEDFIKARLEFKNVLQIDPNCPEGFYMIGECNLRLKQLNDAFNAFRKASLLDPNYLEAHIKTGEVYLLGGKPENALEKAVLVLNKDPDNKNALYLKGAIMASLNKPEEAKSILEKGIALNPQFLDNYLLLSKIYRTSRQFDKAEVILQEGLNQNKDNVLLLLFLAETLTAKEDYDRAEAIYRKIVDIEPDQQGFKEVLIRYLAQRGKLKESEELLSKSIEKDPQRSNYWLMLAELHLQQGKPQDAIDTLNKCLKEHFEKSPDKYSIMNALANIYFLQGQHDQVLKLADRIIEENPDDLKAHFYRGRVLLIQKNGHGAIEEFRTVTKQDPDNPEGYYYLALAHHLNGEETLYWDNLKKAISVNQNYKPAHVALVDYYLAKKEYEAAKKVLDFLLEKEPGEAIHHYRLGLVLSQTGNINEAITEFKKALELNPQSIASLRNIAYLYIAQNDSEQALRICTQHLFSFESKGPVYNLMAEIMTARKEYDSAISFLKKAIEEVPDSLHLYRNLAKVHLLKGSIDSAIDEFKKIREKAPGSPQVNFQLGIFYGIKNEHDQALHYYEQALQADPNFGPAANNMAFSYAEYYAGQKDKLDKALQLAQKFLKRFPNDPQLADTLGWVLYKMGDYDHALEQISAALEKEPNNPEINYHMGMIHYKRGNCPDAKTALDKAFAEAKKFKADFDWLKVAEDVYKKCGVTP